MESTFIDAVMDAPIIAAVKDQEGLEACIANENVQVIFLLFGDLLTLGDHVQRIKEAGKLVIVHIDFIAGLQCSKDVAVDFIRNMTQADGIITTRPNCIRRARELGLYTVLRTFMLDSIALDNIPWLAGNAPDFIEILPGIMPKIIQRIAAMTDIPLLAGGLMSDKEDVIGALDAGAAGISTTNQALWSL